MTLCLLLTLLFIPQICDARIVEEERAKIVYSGDGGNFEYGILLYKMCIDGKLFLIAYEYGHGRGSSISTTNMDMPCTLPEKRVERDSAPYN